jgi:hypothetical protein
MAASGQARNERVMQIHQDLKLPNICQLLSLPNTLATALQTFSYAMSSRWDVEDVRML